VIALTVKFEEITRVVPRERMELARFAERFWHITIHFGFVQVPDISRRLAAGERSWVSHRPQRRNLFRQLGRRGLLQTAQLAGARQVAAVHADVSQFGGGGGLVQHSPENFVEIGRQIEI
jgi:KUP system potassium uptake protein